MLDLSKPVQTRDGREARIYASDGAGEFCLHGAIKEKSKSGFRIRTWKADGRAHSGFSFECLVNVPQKKTGWLNIYEGGRGYLYPTKAEAEYCDHYPNFLKCIPIEYEV